MVPGTTEDVCNGPGKDPALLHTFQKEMDLAHYILQKKDPVQRAEPSQDLDEDPFPLAGPS